MLHDDHPLRIEAAGGSSRRLVVSFTSVGNKRDAWPPKEFVGMASQMGRNHVICVTDISRCWMNQSGMLRKITTVISDYILENGITSINAVGTSMGAYNALILGQQMPISQIIAFTPQYSVHPDVIPDETRWKWFRNQIEEWPHKELNRLPGAPASIYMFHGDTPDEKMHWQRFGEAKNLRHYIFSGANHNFLQELKDGGVLGKIVRAGINERPVRLGKVVKRAGGMRRSEFEAFDAAMAHFSERRKITRPDALRG
ncbi:hypothetical protein N9M66_01335 [Litoreibacter sp.]|nr:hypothetical protein [Litoreibacter sp.]